MFVQEEGLESFEGRSYLWVPSRPLDSSDELLVGLELIVDCSLGIVEFLLCVVLAAKHGVGPFGSK